MNNLALLNILYDNLKTVISLENKLTSGSVLLSFLNLKSNIRYSYLLKSSQEFNDNSSLILQRMLDERLIRPIGDKRHFSITANGVWQVEKDLCISEGILINFIDEKYFEIESKEKNLSDKERVILLALLASRSFSKEYSLDLKQSDNVLNSIERIIDSSYELLFDLGLIDLDKTKLYGKKGNEHRVSQLIRHTDSLHKKTKSIFLALGDQKYILNVTEDGVIDNSKVEWIINKTLSQSETLEIEKYDKISKFLTTIPYDEGHYLYKGIDKSYINSNVDDLLLKVIKNIILS